MEVDESTNTGDQTLIDDLFTSALESSSNSIENEENDDFLSMLSQEDQALNDSSSPVVNSAEIISHEDMIIDIQEISQNEMNTTNFSQNELETAQNHFSSCDQIPNHQISNYDLETTLESNNLDDNNDFVNDMHNPDTTIGEQFLTELLDNDFEVDTPKIIHPDSSSSPIVSFSSIAANQSSTPARPIKIINLKKQSSSQQVQHSLSSIVPNRGQKRVLFIDEISAKIPKIEKINFKTPDSKTKFEKTGSIPDSKSDLQSDSKKDVTIDLTSDCEEEIEITTIDNSSAKSAKRQASADLCVDRLHSKDIEENMHNGEREQEDHDDDNLAESATFQNYKPMKLESHAHFHDNTGKTICRTHPDTVVESASMVAVVPPLMWYVPKLPKSFFSSGTLSDLQTEAFIYACQQHETKTKVASYIAGEPPTWKRNGFLIGDGAGVGKGRTISAIILENWKKGHRRHLWCTASNDLSFDSERDLADIGASDIHLIKLNKIGIQDGILESKGDGVLFVTYSLLVGEGEIKSTTSEGKIRKTRIGQIINWLGGADAEGVVAFDECHRAKNLDQDTKTARAVRDFQEQCSNLRIVYASATGATEPKHMAYMSRLGIWGNGSQFEDFHDFLNQITKHGFAAMELLAMDMKRRGVYVARQLSFEKATFSTKHVSMTDDHIVVYDQAVELWKYAKECFTIIDDTLTPRVSRAKLSKKTGPLARMWSMFWAAHQRFFKYLTIDAKVSECVSIVEGAIKDGMCCVIGLQSTGESRTNEHFLKKDSNEDEDFISTAEGVFRDLVKDYFPDPENRMWTNLIDQRVSEILASKEDSDEELKNQGMDSDESDSDDDMVDESSEVPKSAKKSSVKSRKSSKHKQKSSKPPKHNRVIDSSSSESSSSEENEDSESSASEKGEKSDTEFQESNSQESNSQNSENCFGRPENLDSILGMDSSDEESTKRQEERRKTRKIQKNFAVNQTTINKKQEFGKNFMNTTNKTLARRLKKDKIIKINTKNWSGPNIALNEKTDKDVEDVDQLYSRITYFREQMFTRLSNLKGILPKNTLDFLIDKLGGVDKVAEMTGRKFRVVSDPSGDGSVTFERRAKKKDETLDQINNIEKQYFNDGEKLIAIISDAASTGISLHADKRVNNKRERLHITLELPWSADKAVQQFGRTHRSNQHCPPKYVFLISDLAGETRFASSVAKRLESLGALTRGDRRATVTGNSKSNKTSSSNISGGLGQFNYETTWGERALELTLLCLTRELDPVIEICRHPDFKDRYIYAKDAWSLSIDTLISIGLAVKVFDPTVNKQEVRCPNESFQVSKFLNRILGAKVSIQTMIFDFFTRTLDWVIRDAKRKGKYEQATISLDGKEKNVEVQAMSKWSVNVPDPEINKEIKNYWKPVPNDISLVTVHQDRGMSYEDAANKKYHASKSDRYDHLTEGFYVSKNKSKHTDRRFAVLVMKDHDTLIDEDMFRVSTSSVGARPKLETLDQIQKTYQKRDSDDDLSRLYTSQDGRKQKFDAEEEILEAAVYWKNQHKFCEHKCLHQYWRGQDECSKKCQAGVRKLQYHVLTGALLKVWNIVEQIMEKKIENVGQISKLRKYGRKKSSIQDNPLQIARVNLMNRYSKFHKIVGVVIPDECHSDLLDIINKTKYIKQVQTKQK